MTEPDGVRADLAELLLVGRAMATEASEAILALTSAPEPLSTKSSPTDPVTAADVASDAAIRARLTASRPLDGLLSEDGESIASHNDLRWVIDPLDGTVNYVHQIPHFAVSIACEAYTAGTWRAVVGVVHDVMRGEQFTAVRGGGSQRDGAPIGVADPVPLPQAVLATEFGYQPEDRRRQAAQVARVAPHVADIRAPGSSAIDLCWIAAGRLDGYFEDELSRWDWAAGRLIVEEAGGIVTTFAQGVLAGGPHVHELLSQLLAD
ncbi:inositol monophosphatase family protein [Streptomyces sp. NEAU-Y11]|uniref:inositol monophosphatase family protein n=1 Tax=Streptomyces cucumeris TaxID=2962890 RepID=UPI0020C8B19A|nr:inositol monophosphatase family protein [Streptomyces sp. NEAU-Y11]MCP9211500.1 inositol monophosphatase [Streptomyces sp. NEAU-Y11]